MWLRRPSLADAVLAVVCGVSVAAFLLPSTWWALPIVPATAALVVMLPQRPLTAGALLSALYLVLDVIGLTDDTGAYLAPFFIGVYSVGRYAPFWRGALVSLTFPISSMQNWDGSTIAFAIILTALVFAYGRVVQVRAAGARRAQASAAELQATDAATLASQIVANERARLGGQSLGLLRAAVEGMRADAAAARADLDGPLIESVSRRGRQAVTELRWLLGILRAEPDVDRPGTRRDPRIRVMDVVLAGVLLVMGLVELALSLWERPEPLAWAVAVVLPACVAVRRRFTAGALIVAAFAAGSALVSGVLPTVGNLLCLVVLAWTAGVVALPMSWLVLAVLAAASAGWFGLHDPGNAVFTLFVLALPAFAGFEWGAQDRAARVASAHADRLRADLDARVEAARREERLRLARELHDVASHAVGVMVLQSSAASALRERDPAAARDALRTVDEAASHTLRELEVLFDLLDSGAIGAPGLASPTHEPLERLVDRMRKTGLQISLDQTAIPAHLDDVVYRVVQESLTNVVRHSNARHVRVSVQRRGDELRVSVTDDGTSTIDPHHRAVETPSFGLIGLGERVDGVGGTFRAGWQHDGFGVEAVLSAEPVVRL
ncbi:MULTISPECIES: sensor histidine kinase [Microbacterium]|uniref:sensor histidine kinase n=1 Tax=Microbacterium TaxID=33882 RepID=UPI0013A57B6C|nr:MULTISPECIES: sensor histidine kinase [Microbacterium]